MGEALAVSIRDTRVGLLEYFEEPNETWVFRYDEEYLANPSRPVLGQIFEDLRPGSIVTTGMPCWFSHLLPQGALRRVVSSALRIGEEDHFEMLRGLGGDLPGAVVCVPTAGHPWRNGVRASPQPVVSIGTAISQIKASLAGLQLKLSVREGERGLTLPVHGEEGRWIAKFDDPRYPGLPRIEAATLRWAELAGLPVPEFRLGRAEEITDLPAEFSVGSGDVFLIRRFDRGTDAMMGRLHMEDFGQVMDVPPGSQQYHGTYEQIGAVLRYIAPQECLPFLERLLFAVISGNGDAHLKNWSILYADARTPSLTPCYDQVATVLLIPGDDLALQVGGTRRFRDLTPSVFARLAEAMDVSWEDFQQHASTATARIRGVWEREKMHLNYTAIEQKRLESHMAGLPFLAMWR